jgi:formate dehydrogenase major subunit
MGVSRRDFLKVAGAGVAAAASGTNARADKTQSLRTQFASVKTTICPYCSVGCGLVVESRGGEVINVEGDNAHPINRGTLCPKGASISQLHDNPKRVTKPYYRAKGAREWKEVTWEWAIDQIAERVVETRTRTFETTNAAGQTVNRTQAIAHVGSAALDNEEAYLLQKFMRGLGLVYVEHQARL